MVDSTHVEVNVQPQEEVDLSDDQIQQLLLEAEGRLRGSDVQVAHEFDSASLRYLYPSKYQTGGTIYWTELTSIESRNFLPSLPSSLTFDSAMTSQSLIPPN